MRAYVVAMVVAVLGCGKDDKWDEVLAREAAFRDEMCKCEDAKCAADVRRRMDAWGDEMRGKIGKEKPPRDFDRKKASIPYDLAACQRLASGSGSAPAKSDDPVGKSVAELRDVKHRICACTDRDCATQLYDAFEKDLGRLKATLPKVTTPLSDELQLVQDLFDAISACRRMQLGAE